MSAGPDGSEGWVEVIAGQAVGWDVTWPGDHSVGTSMHYPGGDYPPGPFGPESPEMAIDDDPTTKYLNRDKENSGFIVTPSLVPTTIDSISLTTANDSPERDPASVTILGSNDGVGWSPIVTDLITPLPDERFSKTVFSFEAETPGLFEIYQLIFPTLKNSNAATSMQIAEVELIGDIPEPATVGILLIGALAVVRRKCRRCVSG